MSILDTNPGLVGEKLTTRESNPNIKISPIFEEGIALGILIGGSGVSVGLVTAVGSPIGEEAHFTWGEVPNTETECIHKLLNVGKDLAIKVGIDENNIRVIGASVAGPLQQDAGEISFVGTNTLVQFSNPISITLREQAALLGISNSRISVMNDAECGALGEVFSSQGAAIQDSKIVYLILGTGVGSAAVNDGLIDPNGKEAGHVLIRKKDRVYEYCPFDQLQERGLFDKGIYIAPTDGSQFFEHRFGGPWLAVRFVKELFKKPQLVNQFLEIEKPNQCPDLTYQALNALNSLKEDDISEWNHSVDKNTEKAVNILLRYIGSKFDQKSKLQIFKFTREFELQAYEELGNALKVLLTNCPGNKIILGSTIASVRSDDPDFLATLRRIAEWENITISKIESSTQREVAGFTGILATVLQTEKIN